MSIIYKLISDFLKEDGFKASVILGTSFINNIIQSIGFSRIAALILTELNNKKCRGCVIINQKTKLPRQLN